MVQYVCCVLAGWGDWESEAIRKSPGCLARRWGRPGSLEPTQTSIADELAMIKMEKRIPLDPKLSILDTERERDPAGSRSGGRGKRVPLCMIAGRRTVGLLGNV